ncbi:parB [Symbiodinium microadriaticum]|nr:parB [Symbiodinium microadriaticum]
MKNLIIIAAFALLGLFASEAQAQRRVVVTPHGYGWGYNNWNGGWGWRGSTVYGDWQRGRAAWLHGYGSYLRSRGQYELYHEQARREYIQNWQRYVETRQHLKDRYEARRAAEAAKNRLRRDAWLKKQREKSTLDSKIGWRGKYYSNMEELRNDPEWQQFVEKQITNNGSRSKESKMADTNNASEKVVVFLDNSELYRALHLMDENSKLDYRLLRDDLLSSRVGSQLRFYTGELVNDSSSRKGFYQVLRNAGFEIFAGQRRGNRAVGNAALDEPLQRWNHVKIAYDMASLLHWGHYDTFILVSGAIEFEGVVKDVQRRGVNVEVAFFADACSRELRLAATSFREIDLCGCRLGGSHYEQREALFDSQLPSPDFVTEPKKNEILSFASPSTIGLCKRFPEANRVQILDDLVHQMIHIENCQRGIQDHTSNQYHNRSFCSRALEVGLHVVFSTSRGWAITTTHNGHSEEKIRRAKEGTTTRLVGIYDGLELKDEDLREFQSRLEGEFKELQQQSKQYQLKYICECEPPHNTIRSGRRPETLVPGRYIYPPRTKRVAKPAQLPALEEQGDWLAQRKYNGDRCPIQMTPTEAFLWNRRGTRQKYLLPPVVRKELLSLSLPNGETWLDGELLHPRVKDTIVLFDLLQYGGEYLHSRTQEQRFEQLCHLCGDPTPDAPNSLMGCQVTDHIFLAETFSENFPDRYADFITEDVIEGLVLRRKGSFLGGWGRTPYEANPMAKTTTAPRKKAASPKKRTSSKKKTPDAIPIKGEGKYPLVPLASIVIVERPEEGEEDKVLFFNPRSVDSFDDESMTSIRESIAADGLQQPPVCRAITEGDSVVRIELIAGERRLRSLMMLSEDDTECFDDETSSKVPASVLYEFIPVKLHYNCSDERALRLAFMENHESKSLTITEEIALVERLTKRGLNQKQIATMLLGDDRNVTWVSQTGNFRSSLPDEAFVKLLAGQLSRHVAVKLMSYKPEERQKLYEQAVAVEEQETEERLSDIEDEIIAQTDLADIAESEAEEAEQNGDKTTAAKKRRKAKTANTKATKATTKKERVEGEAGKIKQSHIDKGAASAGVKPKKEKPLSRAEIEAHWLQKLDDWLMHGGTCSQTGNELPEDLLFIMHGTVKAILSGDRDPSAVIREHYIEQGLWEEGDAMENIDDHLEEFNGEEDEDYD